MAESLSAAELAANDQPLKALGITTDPVERAALERRVAHLASPAEYAAFYNEPAPERPWMALEQVPVCHQTMPRWGVIWQQIMLQQHQDVLELGGMDGFCSLNLALHGITAHGVDVNAAAVAEAARAGAALQGARAGDVRGGHDRGRGAGAALRRGLL